MSHVAVVAVKIKDLKSLAKACQNLGLEFRENQKTYKWFGRHVGDYPRPKGFTAADDGKCDHAISVPGNTNAYEVGVCKSRDPADGKDTHQLLWDFYAGGHGLQAKVGNNCDALVHEYTKEVTRKQLAQLAKAKGYTMAEDYNDQTGETTIKLRRY